MQEATQTFKVNSSGFDFSFSKDEIDAMDFVAINENTYNLVKDHQSVTAKILDSDQSGKKVQVEINGQEFFVTIKDKLDQVLDAMGYETSGSRQVRDIKAPMPGLVLEISVKDGQEMKEGDRILVLEAMKMENSITIQANARIKKINVSNGQAVEKGQVLVELE